jgi:hypothetical protein
MDAGHPALFGEGPQGGSNKFHPASVAPMGGLDPA